MPAPSNRVRARTSLFWMQTLWTTSRTPVAFRRCISAERLWTALHSGWRGRVVCRFLCEPRRFVRGQCILPLQKGNNILDASSRFIAPSSLRRRIPRLGQGGVAARSRKFREATLASRRRGGSFNYRLIGGLNEPPRPLHQRRLRGIFLDVASTPPWPRRGMRLLRLDGAIKARGCVKYIDGPPRGLLSFTYLIISNTHASRLIHIFYFRLDRTKSRNNCSYASVTASHEYRSRARILAQVRRRSTNSWSARVTRICRARSSTSRKRRPVPSSTSRFSGVSLAMMQFPTPIASINAGCV